MLGLSHLKHTRVYQEAKLEGKLEGRLEGKIEGLLAALPLLLEAGWSMEQISIRLGLDIAVVKETAQQTPISAKESRMSSPLQ